MRVIVTPRSVLKWNRFRRVSYNRTLKFTTISSRIHFEASPRRVLTVEQGRMTSNRTHRISSPKAGIPTEPDENAKGYLARTIEACPQPLHSPHALWFSPSATPAPAASVRTPPGPRSFDLFSRAASSWKAHISLRTSSPKLKQPCANTPQHAALVVTTGGTGIAPRDVTPEATRAVCTRILDGFAERMRAAGARRTPLAALSRAISGTCGRALIVNLPGSPEGAVTSLEAVLDLIPHALVLLSGADAHSESRHHETHGAETPGAPRT